MPPLVIYHANCWDGFCAAWILKKAYPNAEFYPAHYGTKPPAPSVLSGRTVFIVDFSYKREILSSMAQVCNRIVVLDHHKTAESDLKGLSCPGLSITFDMTKSGGRLAWEYMQAEGLSSWANIPTPWIVDYTEDRDLWLHKLDWSCEINAYIRSFPLSFEQWDKFALINPGCEKWDTWVDAGSAILRREKQIVDDHLRHAKEIEISGQKGLAVNATVLFSDIAGELAKGQPFGACYFDRFDGKRQWSLRSDANGVDVSEMAKMNGGGGHKHAAGFETTI